MIAAVLQMNSGPQRQANLEQAGDLLAQAAAQGAGLAVLPEHFSLLLPEGQALPAPEALYGSTAAWLAQQAHRHRLWLLGGSLAQRGPPGVGSTTPACSWMTRASCAPTTRRSTYSTWGCPASRPRPNRASTARGGAWGWPRAPWGGWPVHSLYLRFPELYRRLRLMGASVLAAPSAFTATTGREHWELLVRGRALENQCYLLAVAQWGEHAPGRASHGQTVIVDPWGRVLAQCPPGVGLACAEMRTQLVERVRGLLDTIKLARLLPAAWQRGGA